MSKTISIALLAVVGLIVVITGLGFLLAYPTMWLVNYLFSATFLTFVFGVAKLSVWQAWALNIITGILFKSTNTSSK